ncbi:LysR family transcriptional regulator [Roseomonas sp. HJA6]|uniref:LysR family transcriptional regulator n=1 Tax=Roseomonas alba TaxID=2846776 RepID=A0ABS7A3P8_9PROT|nr:LysR family transcriptional regulator [Neoroseomonas alba]MBW6396926.1 LysR family transcriptional regulator [Neoroseomonas alba]
MNLRQLEVFHAVMRTGTVTGAARLLGVTQPSASKVLKHCETQLRMPLFRRVGGRLHPTPEAEAILPDIEAIFARLDSVGRQLRDLKGGSMGTLSLAGAFPIANGYLAAAVASFLAERPRVRIVLQALTSPELLDRVVSREVELGVGLEPVVHPEVETEVLVSSGVACVMREDHPLAAQEEVAIGQLDGMSITTFLSRAPLRGYVDRALSDAGVVPRISVQVSMSMTGMALAYHGAGIALVEPFLLNTLPLPGLVARPLKPRIEMKTLLIRARSAPSSALVTRFVAHLRKEVPRLLGT